LEDTNQNLVSLDGDREQHWKTIALPLSIGVFGGIMGNFFVNSIETYGSWVEIVTVLVFAVFFICIYVGPSGWAYKEARKQKKELQKRLSMLMMNKQEQEEEEMAET
jgi:H+/Cl- antiporter ClcA